MSKKVLLVGIIILACILRWYHINWDSNFHLHPDERFLTMVGNAMKLPPTLGDYFNPATSTFNPANIGYKFFVYGVFPVVLNKIVALQVNADNYDAFALWGRFLSGLVDIFSLLFVYKIANLLETEHTWDKRVKYWSSFFYAIAVLPIQLSHFFAVDTFFTFFSWSSLYFALLSYYKKSIWPAIISGMLWGVGFACKVSVLYILPLQLLFISQGLRLFEFKPIQKVLSKEGLEYLKRGVIGGVLFGIGAYCLLRLTNPYFFETGNFFNPQISKVFIENIKELKSWDNPDVWFPPTVQWIHKTPVFFSLKNLVFFGVGLPYFVFICLGIFFITKLRKKELYILTLWLVGFFLYQSTQFVKTIRYFIILYPLLAICAGVGMVYLTEKWHVATKVALVIAILIWPLAFMSIYVYPHSRVQASDWIYQNVPNNSLILSESWDDALPLNVEQTYGKTYKGEQLPVFDYDTQEKWDKMDDLLNRGDYYVLSSNRAWGSIPTVPEKYPKMTQFYKDLAAGKTDYKKVAEIDSYPSLRYLGLPIDFPDNWAEETFTVYDHPQVLIFKHNR